MNFEHPFKELPAVIDVLPSPWLRTARASGTRKRVNKADVDAAAAAVILERWFETRQTTT